MSAKVKKMWRYAKTDPNLACWKPKDHEYSLEKGLNYGNSLFHRFKINNLFIFNIETIKSLNQTHYIIKKIFIFLKHNQYIIFYYDK